MIQTNESNKPVFFVSLINNTQSFLGTASIISMLSDFECHIYPFYYYAQGPDMFLAFDNDGTCQDCSLKTDCPEQRIKKSAIAYRDLLFPFFPRVFRAPRASHCDKTASHIFALGFFWRGGGLPQNAEVKQTNGVRSTQPG